MWSKKGGGSIDVMLKLPDTNFHEKRKSLLEMVKDELETSRKETFRFGLWCRPWMSDFVQGVPSIRPLMMQKTDYRAEYEAEHFFEMRGNRVEICPLGGNRNRNGETGGHGFIRPYTLSSVMNVAVWTWCLQMLQQWFSHYDILYQITQSKDVSDQTPTGSTSKDLLASAENENFSMIMLSSSRIIPALNHLTTLPSVALHSRDSPINCLLK